MSYATYSKSSHCHDVADILRHFNVTPSTGLSPAQVDAALRLHGRNEIPVPAGASLWKLIIEQFQDLLVLILLAAACISFVLALFEEAGDDRWTAFVEPAVILIILIANAAVGVIQETNAAKAIEKLKQSEAREAHVVRDGHTKTILSVDVVPGDIVVVGEGDKVPADCRVISLTSATLSVDESMLTGESEAASKHGGVIAKPSAVNQDKRNVLFSGTLVVKGKGTGVVVATGAHTEMGAIAHALGSDSETKTPLQARLDEFGAQLSKVIGVICVVVWLINIGHFTDPDHGSVIRGAIYYFKIAVALAVAAIPEGLPAVVTTCLALGTLKMARKNAIVRSLPSVETLGCTTVICSDKTGTLTTNMMSVVRVLAVERCDHHRIATREFIIEGDSWSPIGAVIEHTHHSSANGLPESKSTGSLSATAGSKVPLSPVTPTPESVAQAALTTPHLNESHSGNRVTAVDDSCLAEISKICALCNEATLGYKPADPATNTPGQFVKTGAPTEAALLVLAEKIGVPDALANDANMRLSDPDARAQAASSYWSAAWQKEAVLEFDRDRKSMSVVCRSVATGERWLFCKGAPEGVLERCSHVKDERGDVAQMTPAMVTQLKKRMESYAMEGLRCLALAQLQLTAALNEDDLNHSERYRSLEDRMTFVGLAMMMDPPRQQVNAAIHKCRTAGIRVIVITGDNQVTAEAICRRIGVFAPDENVQGKSFTGLEFEGMSERDRFAAVHNAALFSRVEPKHKLQIVRLLQGHSSSTSKITAADQRQGEVVAMTGDGVNDAPALKEADIGIAMGSGTDVAREASKMVLQDDNFATIVMAVEEGRAIYANTKQFIRYLISSNIGEVACIFLTAMIGMPEALIPVQLLWVNLVTDGLPATALGFNPPDKDIMLKPPRGRNESIINRWMFFRYVAVGTYVGIGTVSGFVWWFLYSANGPHMTWAQLTDFHSCDTGGESFQSLLASGYTCDIFHDPRPSTVSLSILVTIEMFNALNALSENQSLLVVPPQSNPYVVLACVLSFLLHITIIYVPFLAGIFHVAPLDADDWLHVLYLSAPIFLLDEALKAISRYTTVSSGDAREKKAN